MAQPSSSMWEWLRADILALTRRVGRLEMLLLALLVLVLVSGVGPVLLAGWDRVLATVALMTGGDVG